LITCFSELDESKNAVKESRDQDDGEKM